MDERGKKFVGSYKRLIVIFGVSFLVLILIAIILLISKQDEYLKTSQTCGDGTFYNSCSLSKPFFCESGYLIEKSSSCGCEEGYSKIAESCFNEFYIDAKENSFNYFFNGEYSKISLIVYKGLYEYLDSLPRSIYYSEGEIPSRRDFIFLKIEDELQKRAIKELVVQIQNIAPEDKLAQARIAISLVQNIPYSDSRGNIDFAGSSVGLARFPYQVLYDNGGACEEKSELLILILRDIGYGVAAFYYGPENHESVGIKCPLKESLDESGYCFVETTAPSILGDSGGDYPGTGRLLSKPTIFLIKDGLVLPNSLPEYSDSKKVMRLRDGKIAFILSKDSFLRKINERYGVLF